MKMIAMAALFVLAACSQDYVSGDVADETPHEVRIAIGYDAAKEGVNTRKQAAAHCEDTDRTAVWYGHDKDGNLVYRCE